MAMLAKIPLIQFLFLDLIFSLCRGKGLEVACRTLDAPVRHVVIVAENNGFRASRLEGHITAPDDRQCRIRTQAGYQ